MEIDLTPLLELSATILGPVLGVLALWLASKLAKHLNIQIEEKHRQKIQDVAQAAVNFGVQKLAGPDKKVTETTKSAVIAVAADYLIAAVPDALKFFGVDPNTPTGREKIESWVEARLPA